MYKKLPASVELALIIGALMLVISIVGGICFITGAHPSVVIMVLLGSFSVIRLTMFFLFKK